MLIWSLCFNQAIALDFHVFYENGKAGLKDQNEKVVIPASYESLGWSNGSTEIFEQTIGFKKDNYWGVLNLQNEVLIPANYHSIVPFNSSHYKASIQSKKFAVPKTGILHNSGKTVISFNYDDLVFSSNKIIAVSKSNASFVYGLIDFAEKTIIPIKYKSIDAIGTLRYAVKNQEDKIALFNDLGKNLTEFEIDSISAFKFNKAKFYKNMLCGIMSRDGSILESAIYADVHIHTDGTYKVLPENNWKIISADDQLLQELKGNAIHSIGEKRYRLNKHEHFQLLNENLVPITQDWFQFLGHVKEGNIVFQKNNKYGLMDTDHKIRTPAVFDSLIVLNKFLIGKKITHGHMSWGLYNFKGERVSDQLFISVQSYNDDYIITNNIYYKGLMDVNGKEILPTIYENIIQVKNNKVAVKFHKQYGILNFKGDWLVGPSHHPLQILKDDHYLEIQNEIAYLKNKEGDIIYFSKNQLSDEGDYLVESWEDGKVWKIDLQGRIYAEHGNSPSLLFEAIYPPSEGFYGIKKDNRYGFVDDQNRLRIANRYEGIGSYKEGLAPVMIRNKWGFIDKSENIVIQPQFEQAEDFYRGISIVVKEGKYGLIDMKGNMIITADYNGIKRLSNDHYLIERNGEYGMAVHTGRIMINPVYDDLIDLDNGFVIVRRNNKYGLLTEEGLNTIPIIYDALICDRETNRYFALQESKWIKK